MKIIAVYSIKGGVGKTASAVNLAELTAQAGGRTLLWDLDPQAAATFYLRIKPEVDGGIGQLLSGDRDVLGALRESDHPGLDVLPADFSYRNMDLVLDAAEKPRHMFHRLLTPLSLQYDWIFLDCPPSISLSSECIFRLADAIVTPLIPTHLSLRTHEQLSEHLAEMGPEAPQLIPFFDMVDRRKKLHNEVVAHAAAAAPEFLKSWIPYASVIEQMGEHRAPLSSYAPRTPAAKAYRALWSEVFERINSFEAMS
ncbi:MAG: ParA family protein [Deltaproteobacteria bacterium]|nr:ParA family protein [Deltaproteobacteria bacterium]